MKCDTEALKYLYFKVHICNEQVIFSKLSQNTNIIRFNYEQCLLFYNKKISIDIFIYLLIIR